MKLTTMGNSLVVKGNGLKLRSHKPQGNKAKKEKLTMDHAVNMKRERGPEEGFTHEVFDSSLPATVVRPPPTLTPNTSTLLSTSLQLWEPQKG